MPIGIAAGVAGAGLLGDLISASSQQSTNVASAQQAQLNRQFQQQQQLQVEGWETQMSDTAMQRRVADLKAAGLNPLLAVGQGGASQPSVSPATGSMPAFGNPGAAFGNMGMQAGSAIQAAQQQQQTAANVKLQADQGEKAQAEARQARAEAAYREAQNPYAATQAKNNADNIQKLTEKYAQDIENLKANYNLTQQNIQQLKTDNQFRSDFDRLTNTGISLNNQRLRYGMNELAADSNFWGGPQAGMAAAAKAMHEGTGAVGGIAAATAQGVSSNLDAARDWTSRRIEDAINLFSSFLPQGHWSR